MAVQNGNPVTSAVASSGQGIFSAIPSGAVASYPDSQLKGVNVVAIDRFGQLFAYSTHLAPTQSGYIALGTKGQFTASGPLAVCSHAGQDTRTDVFAIDLNGKLNVSYTDGTGQWYTPMPISDSNFFPGAPVTAAMTDDSTQTGVWAVNLNGALTVLWSGADGKWSTPESITIDKTFPPQAPVAACQRFGVKSQTAVFAVNKSGAMTVTTLEKGAWHDPIEISSQGRYVPNSFVACGREWSLNQTDCFAVDIDGAITIIYSNEGENWRGHTHISDTGLFLPGAPLATSKEFDLTKTDVFAVDKDGSLQMVWMDDKNVHWQDMVTIGAKSAFLPSAPVTVCQDVSVSFQTNLFVIDKDGNLNKSSVKHDITGSAGSWSVPTTI